MSAKASSGHSLQVACREVRFGKEAFSWRYIPIHFKSRKEVYYSVVFVGIIQ
jgi:hypothetical protein